MKYQQVDRDGVFIAHPALFQWAETKEVPVEFTEEDTIGALLLLENIQMEAFVYNALGDWNGEL